MGRYINDRVFGSDIALPIRTTLERRQQQTMNPQFGQSVSVEDIYYDKNKLITEVIPNEIGNLIQLEQVHFCPLMHH